MGGKSGKHGIRTRRGDDVARAKYMKDQLRKIELNPQHRLRELTRPKLDKNGTPKIYRSGPAKGLPALEWHTADTADTGRKIAGRFKGSNKNWVMQAGDLHTFAAKGSVNYSLQWADPNQVAGISEGKGVIFTRSAHIIDDVLVEEETAKRLAKDPNFKGLSERDLAAADRFYPPEHPQSQRGISSNGSKTERQKGVNPSPDPPKSNGKKKPRGKRNIQPELKPKRFIRTPDPPKVNDTSKGPQGKSKKRTSSVAPQQRGTIPSSRATQGSINSQAPKSSPQAPSQKVVVDPAAEIVEKRTQRIKGGNLVKGAIRFGAGLILDFILDAALTSIIAEFEKEIAEIEQVRIKRLWSDNVYSKIVPQVEWIREREPYVTKSGYINNSGAEFQLGKRLYTKLTWKLLYRLQTDEKISAVVVWAAKLLAGNPGFVELLDDVRYISHELTPYITKSPKPRRYFDPNDEWLRHIEYDEYILVWDAKVSDIANKYRDKVDEAQEQLDMIEEAIKVQSAQLPAHAQQNISRHVIGDGIQRVRDALTEHNFQRTKAKAETLKWSVQGQFTYYQVYQYRIDKIIDEIQKLKTIISSRPNSIMSRLPEEEKALLSMYLDQKIENL